MMASQDAGSTSLSQPNHDGEFGPYILRPLLAEVQLHRDGWKEEVRINCVEYHDGNLYIGTSASEVIHFVELPPEAGDEVGQPAYIPASRLSPVSLESSNSPFPGGPGVQEIILLPRIGKACILCNSTAAFYALPELTPVSGISVVKNCNWIGGVDLNENIADIDADAFGAVDATLLLSLKSKIQVVRLAEKVLEAPKVTYAGSILSVRRDSIACVADSKGYALLDIHRRLTIPLMKISTSEQTLQTQELPTSLDTPTQFGTQQVDSVTAPPGFVTPPGHSRNPSQSSTLSPSKHDTQSESAISPGLTPGERMLPVTPNRASPAGLRDQSSPGQAPGHGARPSAPLLKPHIVSPSREEFLLVIGTKPSEPGVGMFVSLDGEPTRATIQFDRYPEQIVIDSSNDDNESSQTGFGDQDDGHVIASICRQSGTGLHYGIEIQHVNAGQEANPDKHWLQDRSATTTEPYGLRTLLGQGRVRMNEIVAKLSQKRFTPFHRSGEILASLVESTDSRTASSIERLSQEKQLFERDDSQDDDNLSEDWEATRSREGEEFTRRLANVETRLAVWQGNRIWWALRNPLIIRYDSLLNAAASEGHLSIDVQSVVSVLAAIRGRDARTELEYMTLDYVRQKAGLLLLIGVLASIRTQKATNADMEVIEDMLVDSKLDVRVVLSLIPGVRNEIVEGRRGIWVYAGVKALADSFLRTVAFETSAKVALENLDLRITHFLRRYLKAWRNMKGFGSVPDEDEVFRTVDATLLIILLELDERSPKESNRGSSIRSELNDLVDGGVDCFERAVDILESYRRLFVLSRLYQSRKMAKEVLATWQRLIEGEEDSMHEFKDGEQRVREYLKKVSSQALVQEYGIWLANRNPRLGAQIFAEDQGRAPQFPPAKAVDILRAEAPDAVKYYLEHLVFDKGFSAYVDELLTYYLDVVLGHLESSGENQATMLSAYDAYRALQPPKPTYQHFLEENAPQDDEVWKSRLRLLQLLAGSHDYDDAAVARRIESLPGDLLVPETIILAGRQHRHEAALRLLVHKLGDYDTAVAYCLRGGSKVYSPRNIGRDDAVDSAMQHRLFQVVLGEFLRIADSSDRLEQTGALLERFGGWFDVEDVLGLVPDTWSVEVLGRFLISALRSVVREKHETVITRALSSAENLRINHDLVLGLTENGPSIEAQN